MSSAQTAELIKMQFEMINPLAQGNIEGHFRLGVWPVEKHCKA